VRLLAWRQVEDFSNYTAASEKYQVLLSAAAPTGATWRLAARYDAAFSARLHCLGLRRLHKFAAFRALDALVLRAKSGERAYGDRPFNPNLWAFRVYTFGSNVHNGS
jgi:hypothetical protein